MKKRHTAQMGESEKLNIDILAACDALASGGWVGVDWLQASDTQVAKDRRAAGEGGATRERSRQVRHQLRLRLLARKPTRTLLELKAGQALSDEGRALVRDALAGRLEPLVPPVKMVVPKGASKEVVAAEKARVARLRKAAAKRLAGAVEAMDHLGADDRDLLAEALAGRLDGVDDGRGLRRVKLSMALGVAVAVHTEMAEWKTWLEDVWRAYRRQRLSRVLEPYLRAEKWHKPVTMEPAESLVTSMDRTWLAGATSREITAKATKLRRAEVPRSMRSSMPAVQEGWVVQTLRNHKIAFLEAALGGTKYPWHLVAPLEWYLATDPEIASRIGCDNMSVVAQYRDRTHVNGAGSAMGKIKKYGCRPVVTLRRYLPGLEDRLAAVWRYLGATRKARATRWLRAYVPVGRTPGEKAAARKEADALEAAMVGFVTLMREKFPVSDERTEWFPDGWVPPKVVAGRIVVQTALKDVKAPASVTEPQAEVA